ncbi:MAG: DNA mismatch repair endonuclease MutL [Flavobacteriales bacterium]
MSDIIRLLPDNVANQIAAGEVIQRPASVVKELLENSIDSGASEISVVIKDAGKTLIQVIDNGCGMSETDARMCFERHATSKINTAEELFSIKTKGFRGEALASIAAIAHVELKTKRHEEDLGQKLIVKGTTLETHEPAQTPAGTQFSVKNLFFNVPARRNFLKSDPVELKHIIDEFQRVALAHEDVSFRLTHNDNEIFNLSSGGSKQRIVQVFGNKFNTRLLPVDEETSVVEIKGFIGKPEHARRTRGEQYFFVNDRFIKNHYLNHAVVSAFEGLLSKDVFPSYWLYLKVDSSKIDINIHPTKTEIKFEDEKSIYALLRSAVKRGIGKYNASPSLDFDQEMSINIPVPSADKPLVVPQVKIDESYNPFNTTPKTTAGSIGTMTSAPPKTTSHSNSNDWKELYRITQDLHNSQGSEDSQEGQHALDVTPATEAQENQPVFQIWGKYLVSSIKSGLIVIDQKRAHERVLYEHYIKALAYAQPSTQQSLFPEDLQLSASDGALVSSLLKPLRDIGFDMQAKTSDVFVINGIPADLAGYDGTKLLESFLEQFKHSMNENDLGQNEKVALSLAKSSGIAYGRKLDPLEMNELIGNLFACEVPYYTASGKPTTHKMTREELEQKFNF